MSYAHTIMAVEDALFGENEQLWCAKSDVALDFGRKEPCFTV